MQIFHSLVKSSYNRTINMCFSSILLHSGEKDNRCLLKIYPAQMKRRSFYVFLAM